jgi:outer membrane receptor protein involved in Fe transport
MKRFVASAFLLLLVFFAPSAAQTTNATLGGTVSDASRALIPGVSVTAANTQTGIVTRGKHAFKGGYETRFTSSRGFNGTDNPDWYQIPLVAVAGGSIQMTGISTIPGLTGSSITTAENLLRDLSGSVSNVSLTNGFNVQSPNDNSFAPEVRIKEYHQNEWGAFFKDDWKVHPNLTLNVGVRYDWYGVPWEKSGLHALPIGGTAGAPTALSGYLLARGTS